MAPKPVPVLSATEKLHVYSQLLVPILAGFWVSGEIEPVVDLWWRWVTLITYGVGLAATGLPLFGVFLWHGWRSDEPTPEDMALRRRLNEPWQRLLLGHTLVVWLLGMTAIASVLLFRLERITFDAMTTTWGALVAAGVFCALALRRSFKRKVRAAQQQAQSETPS